MSAFIVNDTVINQIVTCMKHDRNNEHMFRKIQAAFNIDPQKDCQAMGSLLMALNVRAVNERYEDIQTVAPYRFRIALCSTIQAYKSLGCWLYQCSEGTVPESELFQLMDAYKKDLATILSADCQRMTPLNGMRPNFTLHPRVVRENRTRP